VARIRTTAEMKAKPSPHVLRLREALAAQNGAPDDVWCFPASEFTAPPPLDYIEVASWRAETPDEGTWSLMCTLGMSDPPARFSQIQPPSELAILYPVEPVAEKTRAVASWLAIAAFTPFLTGRGYAPYDVIRLAREPLLPALDRFVGLALLDGSTVGMESVLAGDVGVEIFALHPIDAALLRIRDEHGDAAFRGVLDAEVKRPEEEEEG
jgi:hypothetical protein